MNKAYLTLAALMLVTFVLGSVHAFSVFLSPLEATLGLSRAQVSLVYSFALVSITLSVTFGYRLYAALPSWWLVAATVLCAAGGLLLSAIASSWWSLFVGYSLAFGISNGIGYGFALQLAGRALPASRGFAMGAVTAAYAVGSILFAQIVAWRIEAQTVASAFVVIALSVLVLGLAAALMLRLMDARYTDSPGVTVSAAVALENRILWRYWLAYLSAVFAGLMAIGHAAAIAGWRGAGVELATLTAMSVGIGSAAGGFVSGWLVDRWPLRRFLFSLPLLSAFALALVGASDGVMVTVWLLGVVGFSYGSIIAIYPVAIAQQFGQRGPQAYGRVFIAWGIAGLIAPWSAGLLYDAFAGYGVALLAAALMALASSLCVGLFRLGVSR